MEMARTRGKEGRKKLGEYIGKVCWPLMRFVINQMATKWQRAAACSTSQEQFHRTLRIAVERERE